MPNWSPTVWKTLRAVIAAACTFTLVTQNDVTVQPFIKYVLGLVIVVLAVLESPTPEGG